jgi:hypothetical protein
MHAVSLGINRVARNNLGKYWHLFMFAGLGTVVHEAFHVAACIVFRHRIVAIKWFDPSARDGALGSVAHTYDRRSVYQSAGNFFIGVAPLLGGALFIYAAARLLLGGSIVHGGYAVSLSARDFASLHGLGHIVRAMWSSALAMLQALFTSGNLTSWRAAVFALLVLSIGSSVALSPADLRGAARGFGVLVLLVLAVNLVTLWMGNPQGSAINALLPIIGALLPLMLLAVVLNAVAATVVLAIPVLANAMRRT